MKLKESTQICKLCFNKILDNTIASFTRKKTYICEKCFSKLKPSFKSFKLDGIKGLSIYEYDTTIKQIIYLYKGCFDYELKGVLLDRYTLFLNLKFYNYYLIPIPSYVDDDVKRGFNHVIEMADELGLKQLNILEKINKVKQSDLTLKNRQKNNKNFKINNINLKGKKVLLFDDICTSGTTLKSCIEQVKKLDPKVIKILVIAKTKDLDIVKKVNKNENFR